MSPPDFSKIDRKVQRWLWLSVSWSCNAQVPYHPILIRWNVRMVNICQKILLRFSCFIVSDQNLTDRATDSRSRLNDDSVHITGHQSLCIKFGDPIFLLTKICRRVNTIK
ncbi:hypothetical protein Plhal304r1_c002g0005201 [Plasmopara halstedii]